ncbi:MAG: gfo/Idh/MocA family oxidoreductase, partial [Bacteroidota bacterium]
MKSITLLTTLFFLQLFPTQAQDQPLRLGVIGLTHTHVHWILGRPEDNKVRIVGIVEKNTD